MIATLYLIRHASPDRTRTDLDYHMLPGPGLTLEGEAEAVKIAEFLGLEKDGIERFYTSPFERARYTAWIIAFSFDFRALVDNALSEWGQGDTIDTVAARLLPFIDKVARESHERGPIALVTHGWIIRTILAHVGMDADELAHYCNQFDTQNPCPCAGVWKVALDDGGATCELVYTPEPFAKYERAIQP